MKQWTIVLSTVLLIGLAAGAAKAPVKDSEKTLDKTSEKLYPKKVTSLKKRPTKAPATKSAVESFKDLPEDDLEFIKALDKQFKLHGDKIKIKVERANTTVKNSKRTVEGDLGYGYYNGGHAGGYEYPRPKFEFYPYSQQDIPPSAPGYHIKDDEEQSTVSIIPSYSYEIKQNPHGGYETNTPFVPSQPLHQEDSYQQEEQGYGYQQQQQQHNEPVIVLRIPGPTKYASHLQALLQQYLEVRASQYLRILEEAELQKQQQQQQQLQHQQVEQQQYESAPEQDKPLESQQYQQQEPQNYGYQEQQQENNYPGIADVYQSYKGRHQESTPIEEPQYEEQAEYVQQPASQDEQQQQYYYMPVEQEQPSQQGYQPIYYVAMPQSDYGYPDSYGAAVPQGYVDDGHLPIAENNPRSTHTKVLFTEGNNKDYSTQYPLPSIKPFERHAPTPTPAYQQYQGESSPNDYQQQDQYQLSGQASQSQSVVSITQRPYNYHAHSLHSKNKKRNATPAPSDSLKKLHAMINRLRTAQPHPAASRTKKEAV